MKGIAFSFAYFSALSTDNAEYVSESIISQIAVIGERFANCARYTDISVWPVLEERRPFDAINNGTCPGVLKVELKYCFGFSFLYM